jgi:pimeloyl-ACP methyl ester carboxylesterase
MAKPKESDPTLDYLRAQFSTGNVNGARRALQQLSSQGRKELEARLGAPVVARMMQTSRRSRGRINGHVIVIHGIMGGKLATIDASGDEDLIWVNAFRLACGRIGDFALNANGDPVDPEIRVVTRGLLDEYMPLVLELGQRWEVLPVAFDWRLDVDKSANDLNAAIRSWAGNQPVHIVAHSMGGLVSRRFMQLHKDTWQIMKDPNGMQQGGRLVMLGTPNRGSFAIPFVLTGDEKTVRWLEVLDFSHDMPELLGIINSFPGSYQMLPSPTLGIGDDRTKLYAQATWGRFPVLQGNLDRGRRFQEALHVVDDPDRLIYVAGYDQATPYRIRVDGPGRFSYQETFDGDGRVPHELGLLPGVPTFYVREKHGDLPSNEKVLASIHELLSTGTTTALDAQKPAKRAVPAAGVWRKSSEIAPISPAITAFAATRAGPQRVARMSPERQASIEADMLELVVSAKRGAESAESTADAAKGVAKFLTKERGLGVRVDVVWGDITLVDGDVFVAGHYVGVAPQAGELALDKVVSGVAHGQPCDPADLVITSHTRRGILHGSLGDIDFFPWANARKTVAIAGMGYPGTFGRAELQILARSLAESVSALPGVHTLNMLLIGTGIGNLRVPVALSALIGGLREALGEGIRSSSIKRIHIVERDLKQAHVIARALRKLKVELPAGGRAGLLIGETVINGEGGHIGDDMALSAVLVAAAKRLRAASPSSLRKVTAEIMQGIPTSSPLRKRSEEALHALVKNQSGDMLALADAANFGPLPVTIDQRTAPTRLSFIRGAGGVLAAAISETAVVPERAVALDWALVDDVIERLNDPEDIATIPDMGALMARLLVPRDFRETVGKSPCLVFELDRATARIQWEMMGKFNDTGPSKTPLALAGPLARQLRTSYSPPPSRAVVSGGTLRALVIGDPGDPDRGLDLEGARHEALEVVKVLRARGVVVDALIGAPNLPRDGELADISPATVIDVLRLLSKNTYDIMHYAGHADFDPDDPEKHAGWIFGQKYFTARELATVDKIPALVIANACLSGLTSNKRSGGGMSSRLSGSDDDLLPGLVDEFFKRGVRNYVGTAWPISDVGAISFSTTLYEALLADPAGGTDVSLGTALLNARKSLKAMEDRFGALWAAYQHYGDPTFVLRTAELNAAAVANDSKTTRKRASKRASTTKKAQVLKATRGQSTAARGRVTSTSVSKKTKTAGTKRARKRR